MEPDAWKDEAGNIVTERHQLTEENAEPLFSAGTLILNIDGQAERLEQIARGLEDARENRDWEEVVDLVYDLLSESEILAEVESSLKSEKGEIDG